MRKEPTSGLLRCGTSRRVSSMKHFLLMIVKVVLFLNAAWMLDAEPLKDLPKALEISKKQAKPVFVYVYDSL